MMTHGGFNSAAVKQGHPVWHCNQALIWSCRLPIEHGLPSPIGDGQKKLIYSATQQLFQSEQRGKDVSLRPPDKYYVHTRM